jgi:nickel-dependent lactate racemase
MKSNDDSKIFDFYKEIEKGLKNGISNKTISEIMREVDEKTVTHFNK